MRLSDCYQQTRYLLKNFLFIFNFNNIKKIDLAKDFEQAHIDCYKQIINHNMFTIDTVKPSIILATKLIKCA